MDLAIKFPDDAEVIRADVARFRALSPDDQLRELEEAFSLYRFLREASGRPAEFDRLAELEEQETRKRILDFARRHG